MLCKKKKIITFINVNIGVQMSIKPTHTLTS